MDLKGILTCMEKLAPSLEARLLDGRERFLAYIRRRIADPELAEDILQESLLRALQAAPTLRDDAALIPWFYQVLRNAITDAYRRRAVESRHVTPLADHEPEDAASHMNALCECFRALMPALKPDYSDLIEQLDLRGETTEAAAVRLGLSLNTLKVRRHRARQALRKQLEATCRVCAEHHCIDCTCRT